MKKILKKKRLITYCLSLFAVFILLTISAAASEPKTIGTFNSEATSSRSEIFIIETFDSEPSKSDTQAPNTWYPDRYPPAGFNSSYFDGDNRLNVTIDKADYLPYGSTFYNYQGRKYDLDNPINTYLIADLYIGSNWETENRHASLWATTFDATDAISGYPIFGFTNGSGFKIYTQDTNQNASDGYTAGWYTLGFPSSVWSGYDQWYNLKIKLTSTAYKYYIDDVLVWTDVITFNSTYFGNMMLQAYNFNETYNVYWDNVGTLGSVHNIDTNEEFSTIQAAISDTDTIDGHTITIDPGMYPEVVNMAGKELTINGSGIGQTIINASSSTGYAISNFGDNTTFKDVALIGSSHYGFKVSHVKNINLENIRVENSGKTGIDLNTVGTASLTNIEVVDTVGGFGIMILDSNNVTVSDITTINNPWGGVSVHAVNVNADNISFYGTFDAQEPAPLLLESDPPYADFVNVDIPSKFNYVVYGLRVGPNYKQWFYQETLTNAKTFANSLLTSGFTYSEMIIYDYPAKDNYYVIPGMLIQDAIDDATSTDTVHIDTGIYQENIVVDKGLTLIASSNPVIDGMGNVCISIQSSDITINGLELVNGSAGVQGYLGSPSNGDGYQNINILNNHIHNIVNTAPPWGFGIYLGTEGERYNPSHGMYDPTLTSFMDFTGLLIDGNIINDTSGASVTLQSLYATTGTLNFTNNEVFNGAQSALWIDSCWDIYVFENNLHDCGNGIFISSYSDGYYEGNPNQQWDSKNIDIIGNDLQSNTNGFVLWDGWPSLINVNQNNIVGNSAGFTNNLAENMSGTCNWWGDISGPTHTNNPAGTGDSCSNYVIFTPWLDQAYPDGDCVGGVCFDPIWVDDDEATGWYDEDHVASIQTAVDRLCDGGTIYVAEGTYPEGLVYIYKSLTMLGPNQGLHGTSISRGPEATICYPVGMQASSPGSWAPLIYITATDVTIDGFTVNDDNFETSVNFSYFTGIASGANNNTIIKNNIVEGFNYTSVFSYHSYPATTPVSGVQFIDNYVHSNIGLYHAIYVQGAGGTVSGNTVDNCGGAVQIQPYSQPIGGTVTNNDFKGWINGIYYNYANIGAGTWIINGNNVTPAAAPTRNILNPINQESFMEINPIEIERSRSGNNWSGLYLRTHGNAGTGADPDVEFNTNLIDGTGTTDPYWDQLRAVQIRNINSNSLGTFYANTFTNSDAGIFVYDDAYVQNIEVHQNNFIGNAVGINNTNSQTINATCNWWDDSSGPSGEGSGSGESVSVNVDFLPWLDKAYPDGNCVGGFCADPIWVDDDEASSWYDWDHVASIQTAVDRLCAGGTIYVSPGTYIEDVTIDKSLTLIGSGNDQTFVKSSSKGPVFTITSNNVIIQDLEITDDTQLIEGIRISTGATTDLAIENVDFTNLGNNPGPGNAYGIVFDTSFTNFFVDNCDFIATNIGEYSRAIGIFIGKNNGYQLSNINIENSTFSYLFVGIYISADTNGLNVMNNIFGPWELDDCTAAVAGLYMGDGKDNYNLTNIVVSGNTFTNYGRGIYMWNYAPEQIYGKIDIYDNTFTDSIWSSAIRLIAGIGYNENVSFEGPITIDNNIFTQSSDVGANVAMIDFRTYCKPPSCDITIINNDLTFSGSVYIDAMYGIKFSAYAGPFNNTLIENNIIQGGDVSGSGSIPSSGIVINHYASTDWPTDTMEMDMFYNEITGFDHGISIYDHVTSSFGGLPTGSIVNVNYNNIYGNALYGIRNDNSESINAECNWWGDTSGPTHISNAYGTGDAVSDNVDYTPWLDLVYPDGDCVGGICADPVWVDDDAASSWYDWDHVATIQTALNRVCIGGTVYVASGSYTENIVVDKSVNLIGDGRDTTIVHNSGDTSQVYTIKIDGNQPGLTGDVLIEGLTFDDNYDWNATVATDHIPSGITLTFRDNRINDSYLYGWWDYHSHGNLEMYNNIVSNVEYGLMLEGWDTGTINIYDNAFELTPGYFGTPVGMFHFTYNYLNCTNPYYLAGNTFQTTAPGYGIVFYGGYGSSLDGAQYTDVTIEENEFNSLGYGGIYLRNIVPAGQNDIGGVHNAMIQYNNFTDCDVAVYVRDNNSNIQVHQNNFYHTAFYGLFDVYQEITQPHTDEISHIFIEDIPIFDIDSYGVLNTGVFDVDATCNWWGHILGPYHPVDNPSGIGANVSDTVTFNPWLSDEYPYGDCDVTPEYLDINQSIHDRGFPVRHAADGDWGGAQSFSPTASYLSKIQIYLRKFGVPEFDLTVELRTGSPEGTLIDSVVINQVDLPSTWQWIDIQFDNIELNAGTDYYIVLPPAPSGVTTSFGYEWGYAFGDQYPGGSFWFTRDGGNLWRALPTMYEFVFKVYGLG